MISLKLTTYFPTILAAVLIAFFSSPLAVRIARRLRLIEVPGESGHKRHEAPTPMAGGLVIAFSVLPIALWLRWFSSLLILGILAGAGVIFVFGLLDDAFGFSAPQKLLGQTLATSILILTGTQVHLFSNEIVNLALTLFWVIGLVNAFNFVDSIDGLALGLAGIASAFFMLVTIEAGQPGLASLSSAALGVCIGAAFYNLPPAKMFLGDSGAQLLGFLMAAVGVAYSPVGLPKLSSWFVPIMVLGVPIFDTTLVVLSRFKRGVKIYRASRDHTYHRLCQLGLEPTRAIFLVHLTAIVLGFASFIALNASVLMGNSIFILAVLSGLSIIAVLEKRNLIGD